jgi:branched-chain amino acid transport system ATP-binding protein
MTDTADVLVVEDLRKEFGGVTAVDGASFTVEEGAIAGLIGPNGAGKTTTFDLVSGFYEPDEGRVLYRGRETDEIMKPSRAERLIWGTYSALTAGAVGFGASLWAGVPRAVASAVGAVGAGGGAGAYETVERAKERLGGRNRRPFRLAQEGLVRTFQITRELGEVTVIENMMLAAEGQKGEGLRNLWLRSDGVADEQRDVRERALERLELLEIDHLAEEYAGNLSGGQRKLLELGRVLMTEPDFVLLDEPAAGVNPTLTKKLTGHIEELSEEGYTFLMVEHDIDLVMRLCDEVIVMDQGKRVTQGTPEEVKQDERVLEAYLGGK